MSYADFVARKSATTRFDGIRVKSLAEHLFPHQRDLTKWALAKGRAAIFADTGLGKTAMELEWARHVSKRGRVLMLTPLAVAQQTVREGERFGVKAAFLRDDDGKAPIVVANYETLHRFDPAQFAGVVLDESSILKSFDGKTRTLLIEAFRNTPYRLACTATPAPNDYTELGNHSEFLGIKTRTEMLAEYFVHDMDTTQDWRLKGHAQDPFWRWLCSWGAVVRKPSDLGHDDGGYALPPLHMHEHVIDVDHADAKKAGLLFLPDVKTIGDQRATRRATLEQRVEVAAKLAREGEGPCLVWCEMNDEADAITKAIPGAVQVKGADDPEDKAERLLAFADGKIPTLVSKASIAGFGMNFQACSRMVFAGVSYSYEQTYQAIRRCWRFGQTKPVHVHVIRAATEGAVATALERKRLDAERMASEVAVRAGEYVRAEVGAASSKEWNPYDAGARMVVPEWIGVEQ